jgi:hypothetical protein
MATRAKRIQTSEMYDSEYKIEKGVVYQRPIGKKTSDSWLVVDFPPYVSENDRKDFDAEMKNLFGAKYVAKKYEDGGEIGKYPFYVILDRFGMVKGFHSKKDAEEYIKHEVELVYEGMPNERKKERAEAKKDYSIVTRAEAKKYSGHIVDDIDGSTYAGGGEIEQQAIYEWNTMDRFVRADLLDEIDEDLNLGESRFEMKAYKYDDLPKNVQEEVVKRLGYDSSGSTYAEGGKIDQQIKFVITPKDKHDTVKGFFDEVYDNQEDYDWIHSFIVRDDGTAILKADKKSFDEAKKQKFFMFEEFEVSESKVYAEGGEIESVAKAIFEPNDFRGKIETTMGNKTLKGFENMIADNDAYDVYVALKPNFEGKGDGFIATTYGDKNAGGGGIMADGRLLLRSFNGVGGNNDKTYELIKDDRDSDGKPYYTLVENPSGKVMAQGDSFKEVNSVANLFSGSTYAGGGEIGGGKLTDKIKVRYIEEDEIHTWTIKEAIDRINEDSYASEDNDLAYDRYI